MTKLLALDAATRTGWALARPVGGQLRGVQCGAFDMQGNTEAKLFASFHDWLTRLLAAEKPDAVAFEQRLASFASRKASDLGGDYQMQIRNENNVKRQDGLRAVVLTCLGQFGVGYYEVAVQSWRTKFLDGAKPPADVLRDKRSAWYKRKTREKARADGDEMGFVVPNTDAADAYGILCWLNREWSQQEQGNSERRRANPKR